MIQRIAAVVAAIAMLLIVALPAMAGGWADIVADGQTTTPRAGGSVEIGFRVMQHGVTPAPWETATVHLANASTGATFDVIARNDDPNGHFVATARVPEAGFWTWQVTLADLATSQAPVPFTVLSKSGVAPTLDTAALLTAIEKAKTEAVTEVNDRYGPQVEQLQGQAEADRTRIDDLNAQVRALMQERDTVAARVGSSEGSAALPILAVVSVAVLAGAAAGFAMAWLSGRAPRTEATAGTLSPTPGGVDRA
ncbi:MAG: flagellar protein FliT [Chloroflexota bacterium]